MGSCSRLLCCVLMLAAPTLIPLVEAGVATADAAVLCKKGQAVVAKDRYVAKYKISKYPSGTNFLEDSLVERWAPGACLTANENIKGYFWKCKSGWGDFDTFWLEYDKDLRVWDNCKVDEMDAVYKTFYRAADNPRYWFDEDDIKWS